MLSRMVATARRHPTAASAPISSSSSSSPSPVCISFQNAAARFLQIPTAYGEISSSNFSTSVSRVITRSSLSTSFMSLKNTSSSAGRMGRRGSRPSTYSTKARRATTASTLTGSSGSCRRCMTSCMRPMKLWPWPLPSANRMSANCPQIQHALARRWPAGLWKSGATKPVSICSSCPLYGLVRFSLSLMDPSASSAPSSCRHASGGAAAPRAVTPCTIWTRCAISMVSESFDRFLVLTSSSRKLVAAVRGL